MEDGLAAPCTDEVEDIPFTCVTLCEHFKNRGLLVTEATIDSLPDCPHQQIETTTPVCGDLSQRTRGRFCICWRPVVSLGHVRKYSPAWTPEGSHVSARSDDLLSEVGHLLVRGPMGFRPYHSSLLSFVCELSEHDDYAAVEKRRARQWLLDPCAGALALGLCVDS